MLPLSYRQRYQTFLNPLKQLQETLNTDGDSAELKAVFSQLQQQFQQEIMALTGEELTGELLSQWQSSQTEIHRTMRLLQTDLMFLQTSQNPETSQYRLATVRDRVERLIQFTTSLTKEDS
ncbi:MAG: heterocyst frequency control protein PatD [Chroococcales cyanobacterium]